MSPEAPMATEATFAALRTAHATRRRRLRPRGQRRLVSYGATPHGSLVTNGRKRDEYGRYEPLFRILQRLERTDPVRERVRDVLVTAHLPLARNIAQRYAGRGEPKDDLVQVARIGLINAVDRYNPDYGRGFLSYAVPTITGEVKRHFRDTTWSMRVPRQLKELQVALEKATGELTAALGRSPRPSELATHLNITTDQVCEGLQVCWAYRPGSLNAPLNGDDSQSVSDTIGDEDPALAAVDNHVSLAPALRELPLRERRIIMLRFFQHQTQSQIAQAVGISQMHVSRLLAQTLEQLRRRMSAAADS